MNLEEVRDVINRLKAQVERIVIGQGPVVDLLTVTLLCRGHILLEGPPGSAKTLLARVFCRCLRLSFGRIQFTPDLMPGDVLGTNLFSFQTNTFTLTRGPIFTDLLLADEINRTPPKTQAALLQAMQERCVTIDGVTHLLPPAFMVVATQNPIEQEGTYPLPEAQLDRFLFKVVLNFPDAEQERRIVTLHGGSTVMPDLDAAGIESVADQKMLEAMQSLVGGIHVSEEVVGYIVDLVRATRDHHAVLYGASTRAASMLASGSRAFAAVHGRDYVLPDDVKQILTPALRHRLILNPGAEVEGLSADTIIDQVAADVAPPR